MTDRKDITPEHFPYFDYRRFNFPLAVQIGNYVFVSGHTAGEYDPDLKKMACKGNLADQAGTSYAKIKLIVESAGGTVNDVVKLTEYVAPRGIGDYRTIDKVKNRYFGNSLPAVTTVGVQSLLRPDALIEVEAVAVLGKDKQAFLTEPASSGKLIGSKAIKKGGLLFIAGQFGIDNSTCKIAGGGDILAQTEQAYRNIKAILEESGATFGDVVKIIDYIAPEGLAKYENSRRVRARYFNNDYPAVAEVVLEKLPLDGALIEIDCIAVLDGKKETYDIGTDLFKSKVCSPAIKKGKLVFLSSLAGLDFQSRQLVGNDVVTQMGQIFKNAEKILGASGLGWKNVVKTVDFIAPPLSPDYRETANVRRRYFGQTLPASTGTIMNRLVTAGPLVQVDFIAVAD